MKYVLSTLLLAATALKFYWHLLPVARVLPKDLASIDLKIDGKLIRLSKLSPSNHRLEPIHNSRYLNLYRTYEIKNRTFIYKALVSEYSLSKYKTYMVIASKIEEVGPVHNFHVV